jgi:cytochrome oxidase Cu insertion factor (SCO1/SenC/PrrC family)
MLMERPGLAPPIAPDPSVSELGLRTKSIVWGGLGLIVLAIVVAFFLFPPPGKPPPVYGAVPDFSLSDQDGRMVSLADWSGHICVVDLIFTRCASQCLLMEATLQKLQSELPATPSVHLISLTSDPAYDTPEILKKYGQRWGARDGTWSFLTGPKSSMQKLVSQGLKLSMVDKKPAEQETPVDLVIHSTKLVLVDQHGRIRGYYDGETPDCLPPLLAAIQSLAREN